MLIVYLSVGNRGCTAGWMYYAYNYVRINRGVDRPYNYEARVSTHIVYTCYVTPSVTRLPREGNFLKMSSSTRHASPRKYVFPYSHK